MRARDGCHVSKEPPPAYCVAHGRDYTTPRFLPSDNDQWMAIGKRTGVWLAFLLCLLVLSFSATPYCRAANFVWIGVRGTLVAVLSILALRDWWRQRNDPDVQKAPGHTDAGDRMLQRFRQWHYGAGSN